MSKEYKCGYCNKTYDQPGYCQHGQAKVELKPVRQIGGSHSGNLGRRQWGKSFGQVE